MTCLPLGAYGAKWPSQQNEHLVYLNTSGDVLVKIVEKVRAHFMYIGSGHGLHYKLFLTMPIHYCHKNYIFHFVLPIEMIL